MSLIVSYSIKQLTISPPVDQTYAEPHDRRLLIVDDDDRLRTRLNEISDLAACDGELLSHARLSPVARDQELDAVSAS